MKRIPFLVVVLGLLGLAAPEETSAPTRATGPVELASPRARAAQKTYLQTAERLKAEYEAKLKKAREAYLKVLQMALRDAERSKKADAAAEAEKIRAEIARVEREAKEVAKKPARPTYELAGAKISGGDGSTLEDAVIIVGDGGSPQAVEVEGLWARKHLPGYRKQKQSLRGNDGKTYDEITYVGPEGEEKKVYFDITKCFGFPGLEGD